MVQQGFSGLYRWSHMELFPRPLQTYKQSLTNFICSEWGYSPHHVVTITLVGPDSESRLKSWITAGCQMTAPSWSCSGWGSHPTWNDSKIHSIHIKINGDWHYHMQWMGIWSPHHAVTITLAGDPIWKVCWNHGSPLSLCWVPNDTIMHWLRPYMILSLPIAWWLFWPLCLMQWIL